MIRKLCCVLIFILLANTVTCRAKGQPGEESLTPADPAATATLKKKEPQRKNSASQEDKPGSTAEDEGEGDSVYDDGHG
ncbi:hypothetical protein [Pelobacter seleniigenes]|uniref:hypothetical protein n=1 Tax=Pelobacter seleniigenes TaxID=407188 RepID=UPI0004A6DAAD|nr:hypothetical protein [Pelobacter seleniigenes]